MADITKTVSIIFRAVDEASQKIDNIGSSLGSTFGDIEQATQPIYSATTNLLALEGGIATLGAVAGGFALKQAVDFEEAMADLLKVLPTELDSDQVADLGNAIGGIAVQFGESETNAVALSAALVQAGFEIEDVTREGGLLEVALTGAKVAFDSVDSTVNAIIPIMKGFGLATSDAGRILDVTNELSNNFAFSAQEIAEGLAIAGPNARNFGFEIEEMAALLTPVIEVTQNGSKAATDLSIALQRIVQPAQKTQTAMRELEEITGVTGLTIRDQDGALRSLSDILPKLFEAWPKLTDTQKQYYSAQLAGLSQSKTLNILLNDQETVTEALGKAQGAAIPNAEGFTSSQVELNRRLAIVKTTVEQAGAAFSSLVRVIGDQYSQAAGEGFKATTDLFNAMKAIVADENGALAPVFEFINEKIGEFVEWLRKVTEVLPEALGGVDFQPLLDSIDRVFNGLGSLFDYDLTTEDGLRDAIQLAVDALAGLNNTVAGILEGSLGNLFDWFVGLIDYYGDLGPDTQQLAGRFLSFGSTINIISGYLDTFFTSLGLIGGALGGLFALQVATKIGGWSTSFGSLVASVNATSGALGVGGFLTIAGSVGAALGTFLYSRWENDNWFLKVQDDVFGTIEQLGIYIETASGGIQTTDDLSGEFAGLSETAGDAGSALSDIENEAGNLPIFLKDGATAAKELTEKLTFDDLNAAQSFTDLKDAVSGLGEEFGTFGKAADGSAITLGDIVERVEALVLSTDDLTLEQLNTELKNMGFGGNEAAAAIAATAFELAKASTEIGRANIELEAGEQKWRLLADGTQVTEEQFRRVRDTVRDGTAPALAALADELDTTEGVLRDTAEAFGALESEADLAGRNAEDAFRRVQSASSDALDSLVEAGTVTGEFADDMKLADDATKGIIVSVGEDGVPAFEQFSRAASDAGKKTKDEMKEAKEETDEFRLKLLEIASDERIKTIEAQVDLKIAQLEADTEVAISLIESIESVVQSTQQSIVDLFNIDAGSLREQFAIERQIEEQNKIQQALVDAQVALLDAQVDYMRQRADALAAGNALITVKADGLEPQLEAFMFELLKKIQIEASSEGASFLLGLDL